ncbi:fggap repeat domain containing protein [Plakobranchus ocellatus]|uniref:Fggap repeat domain containing protein n=1 Tax=Plakobranchus ocellatus TaxID=259542 RepID=A0AAV3YRR2_9GAST|nr:fggap repeat domain containing protein [Plakobranchus ocellatus]
MWRKRSELTKFVNGKFMTDEDRCPSPIITDLEGDGVNEIVLISNDLQHLNILAMPLNSEDEDKTLAHVIVKNRAEISFNKKFPDYTPKPHVVGVGFTDPYLSLMQIRKQIIVVVSEDWQVLCYNHQLELLWHQQLALPEVDFKLLEVKALTVTVSPFSIEQKHRGLVVVAGNFRYKLQKPDLYTDFKMKEEKNRQNRTIDTSIVEENETLTQFSTFALSAEDGALLWMQTFGESQTFKESNKSKRLSDIHWKLQLHHKSSHKGESPWKDYGSQLDQFLPHIWADNSDTQVRMARINKEFERSSSEHSEEVASTTPAPALSPHHLIGFSYGGHRPHSPDEHVKNPNSLVLRCPDGLRVVSLVTGQPRTSLIFPADRSLYMDMDGDGHAEKLIWDAGQHYTPCFLDIWRVNPILEKVDQIGLCTSKRLFWTRSWSMEEDIYKKIPPQLIKSVARKSGVLRHFLGHNLFEDNTYDIITYGGLGRVSSIGLDGTIHWQTLTEAKWADISMNMRRTGGRQISDSIKEEFLLSFQPSMVIMPIEESGPKVAVAVAAWNTLSVVDLVEGILLSQHSLPAPSAGPLVYGDFDNDGLMDIIVTCKKGYIGFSLKLQHNYEYTVLYTVIVFLVIILFSWLVAISSHKDDSESDDDDDEQLEDDTMLIGGDDNISRLQGNDS